MVILTLLGVFFDPRFFLLVLAGLLGIFAFWSPNFGLGLILCFLVVGQLGRVSLPVGGRDEVLILDILIPLVLLGWLFKKIYLKEAFPKISLTKYLLIFSGWLILGLVLALNPLSILEVAKSGFYLVRFLEYAALFFLVIDLIKSKKDLLNYLKVIIGIGLILTVLGFIQLYFVPDFSFMASAGWDPHENRLLGTWFDPNFLGGFLVLGLSLLVGIYYAEKKREQKPILIVLGFILLSGIIFTYSRSAYLMLLVVFLLWGIIYARKLLIAGILILVLAFVFVPKLQDRVKDALNFDVTVQARIRSFDHAFQVIKKNPVWGAGYNTYRYTQTKLGLISEEAATNIRSTSGADSSLLTIFATSGIVGIILYLYLWFLILKQNLKLVLEKNLKNERKLYFGIFTGLIGLFIYSFFVNGLLYPYLMIVFWILVAIIFRSATKPTLKNNH